MSIISRAPFEVQHWLPRSRVRVSAEKHGRILSQRPNQIFKHWRSLRRICRRRCRGNRTRRRRLSGNRASGGRSCRASRSCRTGWRCRGRSFALAILLLRNLFAKFSLRREQPAIYNLKTFVLFGFRQRNLPQVIDQASAILSKQFSIAPHALTSAHPRLEICPHVGNLSGSRRVAPEHLFSVA